MSIVVTKRAFHNGSLVNPGEVIKDYQLAKGEKLPTWAAPAAVVAKPKAEKSKATPNTTQALAGDGKSDNLPHGAGDVDLA